MDRVSLRNRGVEGVRRSVLEDRLEMERLVASLSRRFMKATGDELDLVLQDALAELGRLRGADRSYVFLFAESHERMSNSHEWCAEGIPPRRDALQKIETKAFPWWMERLRAREMILLRSLDELPPEAVAERRGLEGQEILSLVVVPMVFAERLVGYVGFDGVRSPMSWQDGDILLLDQVADLMATVLVRRDERREADRLRAAMETTQRMEAIGRLAGGVAHDFNNLLTAITGYAEILKCGHDLGPAAVADVDEILRAATRAADLTSQLLAFSRKQVISPRVVDPNVQVLGAVRMIDRLIGEQIDFVFEPSPRPWMISVDPGQLEQIVVNLAVNARDAMPEGGTLRLRISSLSKGDSPFCPMADLAPGDWVTLTVEDSGHGMDEETLAHVFEPFFTTKSQKGTGLGLATVYGIVKQSGGEIRVRSRPGRGTCFTVFLPRVRERPPESAEVRKDPSERASGRILVVEDDERVRALAVRILRGAGFEVEEAADGGQALAMCVGGLAFDLLLTDVVLSRANGREVYEALRTGQRDLRVLYMSGYTDEVIARHGVFDGGASFLGKPFSPRDLVSAVRKALTHASSHAPGHAPKAQ